ncbi:MAG: hypothetical protein V4718_13870 [Pseudomonadota bacterium]
MQQKLNVKVKIDQNQPSGSCYGSQKQFLMLKKDLKLASSPTNTDVSSYQKHSAHEKAPSPRTGHGAGLA